MTTTHPLPMLAVAGEPFDSTEYLFEVKWDGVRALAAGGPTWALWGRDGAGYLDRYPELAVLARLPWDTVLDGELVRWGPSGVPTLGAILRRHQLVHPGRIARASRNFPVPYIVFDLLRLRGRSLLQQPLGARRAALKQLLLRLNEPALVFSEPSWLETQPWRRLRAANGLPIDELDDTAKQFWKRIGAGKQGRARIVLFGCRSAYSDKFRPYYSPVTIQLTPYAKEVSKAAQCPTFGFETTHTVADTNVLAPIVDSIVKYDWTKSMKRFA